MIIIRRLAALLCLLMLSACGEDPMEACMKKGLGSLTENGASRGEYIKARDKVRQDCERRLH